VAGVAYPWVALTRLTRSSVGLVVGTRFGLLVKTGRSSVGLVVGTQFGLLVKTGTRFIFGTGT